jgi:hypothetical protein
MFIPFVTVLVCNSNQPPIVHVRPFREIKRAIARIGNEIADDAAWKQCCGFSIPVRNGTCDH